MTKDQIMEIFKMSVSESFKKVMGVAPLKNKELAQHPITKQGSKPSEICPACNGTGLDTSGLTVKADIICENCSGTGKLLPY